MATPIDSLKREHRAIEAVIRSLKNAAQRLEEGESVSPEELDRYIDFIRNFADGSHHHKEERVLFPAMNAAGFPNEVGPIACMLGEHEQGRAFVRRMLTAVASLRQGDPDAAREFSAAAAGYSRLLLEHIVKEDTILFRMAESIVGNERLEALAGEFAAAEKENARYEEYETWANSLEAPAVVA